MLDREAPGLAEAMRLVNPLGRLSRQRAGTIGALPRPEPARLDHRVDRVPRRRARRRAPRPRTAPGRPAALSVPLTPCRQRLLDVVGLVVAAPASTRSSSDARVVALTDHCIGAHREARRRSRAASCGRGARTRRRRPRRDRRRRARPGRPPGARLTRSVGRRDDGHGPGDGEAEVGAVDVVPHLTEGGVREQVEGHARSRTATRRRGRPGRTSTVRAR